MNDLDRRFRHRTWFRGEKMTVREFLDWAAKAYGDMEVIKRPAKEQSDYLLGPLRYEKVLVSDEGRGFYRLSQTEYEYFVEKRKQRIRELFARELGTMEKLLQYYEEAKA